MEVRSKFLYTSLAYLDVLLLTQFQGLLTRHTHVICATKWCLFSSVDPTPECVRDAVQDRLDRTGTQTVGFQVRRLPHRNVKLFTRIFLLFLLLCAALLDDFLTGAYVIALQHLHALQRPPNNLITALDKLRLGTDEICTALGPGVIVSNQTQVISSLWRSPTETLII